MAKKGENVYLRKDNRWEARFEAGKNEDGSIRYGSRYGATREAALQRARIAQIETQGPNSPLSVGNVRFSLCCNEWLAVNRNKWKESTFVKYSKTLERHVIPLLGDLGLDELDPLFTERMSRELTEKRGLSSKTAKDILTMVGSILKYAEKRYNMPLSRIGIVTPKVPRKEMRVLTMEEQIRLMQYLSEDTDAYKFGVLLCLLTGMRIGEVCALRQKHISLHEKTVRICHTMQRLQSLDGGTKIVISEPKSETSVRTVPLTRLAERLCTQHRRSDPEAFVLTGDRNRFVEPRAMQYHFARYTATCGLQGVHFHTLRHTFATRCVEVDFEIKSLSEILGHSTPRITLERYVHSSLALKRNNMQKLTKIGF